MRISLIRLERELLPAHNSTEPVALLSRPPEPQGGFRSWHLDRLAHKPVALAWRQRPSPLPFGGSACRYLALRAFVNKARPTSISHRIPFHIPRDYFDNCTPPIPRDYRGA